MFTVNANPELLGFSEWFVHSVWRLPVKNSKPRFYAAFFWPGTCSPVLLRQAIDDV